MESWLLVAWGLDLSIWSFRIPFVLFSSSFFLLLSWITFNKRYLLPNSTILFASIVSFLFSVHWLSYYLITNLLFPEWKIIGFLAGTTLNLCLYFCFQAAIFLSFQKRLVDAEEKALSMAFHDPLTGFKNKRYMLNVFEHAIMLANRPHQVIAVLYIDLYNFKPINDTDGHEAGDEVLRIVSKRIKDHTRSTDICVRIGGDEFVIIATQLEHKDLAIEIANKLLSQLEQEVVVGNKSYCLGASIGISLYPEHGVELQELVNKADFAMYEVKNGCKNGYKVFSK